MHKLIVFGVLSVFIIIISWRTLFNFKSHGFYRFLALECILWLFSSNYIYWFESPFSISQILSWILLIYSGILVISGILIFKKHGKPTKTRSDKLLYKFEKTSQLIDSGIFRYIRHPLYSSLLFLTWGIFLKNTSYILFIIAILSSIFIYVTSIFDEIECIKYFGNNYRQYMKQSKRFIPFVL